MSNVFARLFEEGERQQHQLQAQPLPAATSPDRTVAAPVRTDPPNHRTPERIEQPIEPNDRTGYPSEPPNERSEDTPERLPALRPTVRYSYEFYIDQVEAIRRLRAQRELAGQKVGLSEIVREAVDVYLQSRKRE